MSGTPQQSPHFLFSNISFAAVDSSELNAAREYVIYKYIQNLEKADYQSMASLFKEDGTVISTSRGKIKAQDFFNAFLPNIMSAHTVFHQIFISSNDNNHYAARFHFNFTLKDGEIGDGEYVDEFIFADKSTQLINVSMFENLKFDHEA